IAYDSYGDVTSVRLPTGSTLSYGWANFSWDGMTPTRRVTSRTVDANDGNGAHTWNDQYIAPASFGLNSRTIVTSPPTATSSTGDDSVYDIDTVLWRAVTERHYQGPFSNGTGVLLKTINTHYRSDYSVSEEAQGGGYVNIAPDSITTILPNGQQSQVTYSYDSGAQFHDFDQVNSVKVNYTPLIYGSVVTKKEFDYGTSVPGSLLRETDTTYPWQGNGNYLTANMLDSPASVILKDGHACAAAETDSAYDEPAYLTTANIDTQHGTPGGVRGNLTTVTGWLASAG